MNIKGDGTYYQVVDQEQAKQVLSRIEEISDKIMWTLWQKPTEFVPTVFPCILFVSEDLVISWMRFDSTATYIVSVEDHLDDFLTNIANFAERSERNYSCERMAIKEPEESHKKEEDIKEKKVISISDNMTFIIGYPFGMPRRCLAKRGLTGLNRFAQRINLNDDDFLKLEEKEIYEYSASYKEASKLIWLKEYYKGDVNGSIDKVYAQRIRAICEKVDIDKELLRCNEKLKKELEELKVSSEETISKLRKSLTETKRSLSEAQEKIKNMEMVKKNLLIVSEAINKVIATNEVES